MNLISDKGHTKDDRGIKHIYEIRSKLLDSSKRALMLNIRNCSLEQYNATRFWRRRFVKTQISNEDAERTEIFSTFYFSTLSRSSGIQDTPEARYQKVRRWTKNTDIFTKDFIIIPINYKK